MELYTDFPERLQPGEQVFVGPENRLLTICSRREHNEGLLLGFEGISTPEEAGLLRNRILSISSSDAHALQAGEYFFHDLYGLNIVDESDRSLGTLSEILQTGANDVYVATNPAGVELLLPAIPEVILRVDLKAGKMIVHLLPGLAAEEPDKS